MREVRRGHASAAMCLGVFELLCGIIVTTLTLVASSKAEVNTKTAPWWAGICVSASLFLFFVFVFLH